MFKSSPIVIINKQKSEEITPETNNRWTQINITQQTSFFMSMDDPILLDTTYQQLIWDDIPCKDKQEILMVQNNDILCHLGNQLMSLCNIENLTSDLLLVHDYGSHVYIRINPGSKTDLHLKDQQEHDILNSLILLLNKQQVEKLKYKSLTKDQTLELFQECEEEFASNPTNESQVTLLKNYIQNSNGKQIFDLNQYSEMLLKKSDDFSCYKHIFEKQFSKKDDALQCFINSLLAVVLIMKRKAILWMQIKNSKESQSKEKDLSNSGDMSVGLSFIEDSVSENNLLGKPTKFQIEVLDIKIQHSNNREFGTSQEQTDFIEEKHQEKTDLIVKSLFKKIHQVQIKKQRKLLNMSYQSNNSTDKSECRSQRMYSPPGLNIKPNLKQGNQQFLEKGPIPFQQYHNENQDNQFQFQDNNLIEENFYENYPNENTFTNSNQLMQNQNQINQWNTQQQLMYIYQQMQNQQQQQYNQQQQYQQMSAQYPFYQQYQNFYQPQYNQRNYQYCFSQQNAQNIQQINNYFIMMNSHQNQQNEYQNMHQQQQYQYQGNQSQQATPAMQVIPVFNNINCFQNFDQQFESNDIIRIQNDLPPRFQRKIFNRQFNKILKRKHSEQKKNYYQTRF